MKNIMDFIKTLPSKDQSISYGVYPKSINAYSDGYVFMMFEAFDDVIVATNSAANMFDGEVITSDDEEQSITYKKVMLDHHSADILRTMFSFTKPVSVLKHPRTIGLGDRLGIAGPTLLRSIYGYDLYPVMAQTSIHELEASKKTFEEVLDLASFAVFKEGYTNGFGADANRLKHLEDIEHVLLVGYSMVTLDLSDQVKENNDAMSTKEVIDAFVLDSEQISRYLDQVVKVDGVLINFDEETLKRTIMIYQQSIDYTVDLYQAYWKEGIDVDLVISIDQTKTPTEPHQHYYIANELKCRGVKINALAPHFYGEFQKGIDYVGDIEQFEEELKVHALIAKTFDYKLCIHHASDKFAVLESIGKFTDGHFHIKTSGTHWLEAMKLIATIDPKLYRNIHAYALSMFRQAHQFEHVSCVIKRIPKLELITDDELPRLFYHNDVRQLLHITCGYILSAKNEFDDYIFKSRLFHILKENEIVYAQLLEKHIIKHLELLYKGFK